MREDQLDIKKDGKNICLQENKRMTTVQLSGRKFSEGHRLACDEGNKHYFSQIIKTTETKRNLEETDSYPCGKHTQTHLTKCITAAVSLIKISIDPLDQKNNNIIYSSLDRTIV